jgi:hypothetical protein
VTVPQEPGKVQRVKVSTGDPVTARPDPVEAAHGDTIEWHVTQGSAQIVFTNPKVVMMRKTLATPGDPAVGIVVAGKARERHGYAVWVPRDPGIPPPGGAEDKCTLATLIIAP